MSTSVEDEVVSLKFDNRQFEAGVATSLNSLAKLQAALNFGTSTTGLDAISQSINSFDSTPMQSSIQEISNKWSAMRIIGVTALATVVSRATSATIGIGKSLLGTLNGTIFGAGKARAIALQQATFQFKGLGLNVEKTMASALAAVKGTAFGLQDAATLAAQFGGAGIKAGAQLTGALRGVSGIAAQTGRSYSEIGQVMAGIAGVGKVTTEDLMQFGVRGLNVSAAMAKQMGTTEMNVRAMVSNGQISFQQFAAMMDKAFGKNATKSNETYTGSLANMKAAFARIGADVASPKIVALRDVFNSFTPVIDNFHAALAPVISAWTKWLTIGSQTVMKILKPLGDAKNPFLKITAGMHKLGLIFWDIRRVASDLGKALSDAFHNVFGNSHPDKTFNSVAKAIHMVFSWMRKLTDNTKLFQGIFTAIFAVLDIAWQIVSGLAKGLISVFTVFSHGTGTVGDFVLVIGNMLAAFDHMLKKGQIFSRFFLGIADGFKIIVGVAGAMISGLSPLLPLFSGLGSAIAGFLKQGGNIADGLVSGLLSGLSPEAIKNAVTAWAMSIVTFVKDALGIHSPASTMVPIGYNIIAGIAQGLGEGVKLIFIAFTKIFSALGTLIHSLVSGLNFQDVVAIINSGFFIALYLSLKKFIDSMSGVLGGFASIGRNIGGTFKQLTANLKTMQQGIRAKIIREIAISVGILALAAIALSQVDAKKLGVSLGAITGMMTGLILSMKALTVGTKGTHVKNMTKTTLQLLAISDAMVAFSSAILILSGAVALLGQLKPETLKKGLLAVGALMTGLVTATAVFSKTGGGATILAASAAMLIMAVALTAMSGVLQIYANMDWQTLVQGGGSAALVIAGIGLALQFFGKGSLAGSAALLVASVALGVLAVSLKMISGIGLGNLIKTVIALDLVLASVAGAAEIMSGAEGGAGSMIVMAAAIIIMAEALKILSKIPILDLVKAVGALVVVLAILAGASILLAPIVPLMASLGGALVLLGAAMFLGGVGMLAFATGLGILATVGPAGFAALAQGIGILTSIIPTILDQIQQLLIGFLDIIIKAAPKLLEAFTVLLGALIDALIKLLPKVGKLVEKVIHVIIKTFLDSELQAGKAVLKFIMSILNVLDENVPKFIKKGTDLMISVITGMADAGARLVNALGRAILKFLKAFDLAIRTYEGPIIAEGFKIAGDLVKGLVDGIKAGAGDVASAAAGLAKGGLHAVTHPWEILSPSRVMRRVGRYFAQGAALGIKDHSSKVEDEASAMANKAMRAVQMTFANSRNTAGGMIDLQPKITPVLDLTRLQKDATKISSTLGHHTIKTDTSRAKARDIASDHASRHNRQNEKPNGDVFNFNQEIKSKDPIDRVQVYRGTNSQIALFKEVTRRR